MWALIVSIATLAIVDSINPVELFAGIYFFTIKKPISRILPYTIGIFVFHLLLGFVFFYTFHWLSTLKIFDNSVLLRAIEIICGALLIFFGFRMRKENKSTGEKILDPKPWSALLLGVAITASAIPESVSYYAALGMMVSSKVHLGELTLLLLLYNIIFVLPLFILLGIYIIFREKSASIFEHIRNFIKFHINRILKVVLIAIGLVLVADFILSFFGKSFL